MSLCRTRTRSRWRSHVYRQLEEGGFVAHGCETWVRRIYVSGDRALAIGYDAQRRRTMLISVLAVSSVRRALCRAGAGGAQGRGRHRRPVYPPKSK